MKEEEKNKETEQNDLNIKPNIIENEINPSCNTNNSEVFRHMNKEKIKTTEEKFKDSKEQTMEIKSDLNNNQNQNVSDLRTKNEPLRDSVFNFKDNRKYYLKINRCLTAKFKNSLIKSPTELTDISFSTSNLSISSSSSFAALFGFFLLAIAFCSSTYSN